MMILKMIAASALLLALSTPAFASSGGEGNNTNCNGQGNPNSPCVPSAGNGGAGGQGGAGGSATVNQTIRNNARANARASALGVGVGVGQGGAGGRGGNARATGGRGGDASAGAQAQGGGVNYTEARDRLRVPDANAPAIWSNNPCIVGLSGGVAVAGFGASFGAGIEDRDCTRRANAQHLTAMGEREAAREVLCNNDEVRSAFARTGRPCAADAPPVAAPVVVTAAPAPAVQARAGRPAYCSVPGIQNSECR